MQRKLIVPLRLVLAHTHPPLLCYFGFLAYSQFVGTHTEYDKVDAASVDQS